MKIVKKKKKGTQQLMCGLEHTFRLSFSVLIVRSMNECKVIVTDNFNVWAIWICKSGEVWIFSKVICKRKSIIFILK